MPAGFFGENKSEINFLAISIPKAQKIPPETHRKPRLAIRSAASKLRPRFVRLSTMSKTENPKQLTQSPTISEEAKQAAALVIARFRRALDATLGVPEWQNSIQSAIDALDLPGQRQGINFVQAVLSLPLESKRDVVSHIFDIRLPRLKRSSVLSLNRAWGFSDRPGTGAELTLTQWRDLKRALELRLASRYRSYKNAQIILYQNYEYISFQAAKEICRSSDRREDCEQEGALGLLQAIDRIEPNKPFASYAFQWTKRRIRNYLMKNSIPFSAPVNLISKVSRSVKTESHPCLDTKNLSLALNCIQQPHIEFSSYMSSTTAIELESEILSPIAAAARTDLVEILEKALAQLSPKQREVIALRFGILNKEAVDTLQGIARATGISRQQVTRREKRALARLEGMFSPFANELA